jgi:alcohol dehydrogenase class IV
MTGVFHYVNPATIYWGNRSLERLAEDLDKRNVRRPYLVSTKSLLANDHVMARFCKAAGRQLAGMAKPISQHAPQADLDAAIESARQPQPDGIVSLGGGSPIDAAKIVALELGELPHVAIPTTLSAAELAPSAGATDAQGRKAGRRDPRLTPAAVIYDPELALHTPSELWLSTGIRALDHAVESVLEPGEHPYSDALALDGIRRLFASLPAAHARPGAVDVRGENQIAAWLSYSLVSAASGLSHTLGKQIGSKHGIPHGVTSCLLLPHVMRYRARTQAARLALMAPAMGVARSGASDEQLALAAADAVQNLIRRLELPRHLTAYKLSDADLKAAAEPVTSEQYPLDDLLAIYRAAA